MSGHPLESGHPPDLHSALRRHFGYPAFRAGQERLVRAALDGRDALGILPTGGGKSVCYMLPAALLPGLTLVVSPLISLMQDQVARAAEAGVPAALLNSTLTPSQRRDTLERARSGRIRLLLLAPERFQIPRFRAAVARLEVSLMAVDEAHCISEWGHDFRPSYRLLGDVRRELGCPALALTATATPRVREDIVEVLGLRRPVRVVGSFDRPNLSWEVRKVRRDRDREEQLVRVVRRRVRKGDGVVVVYAGTRRTVERLRARLARTGLPAEAYHGGMPAELRARVQEAFMSGECPVVCATNAFGMGVDKPDVREVVHWQLPGTLESYYQEAGRGGRDGEPARCLAFTGLGDADLHRSFLDRSRPRPRTIRRVRRVLARMLGPGRHGPVDLAELRRRVGETVDGETIHRCIVLLWEAGVVRPASPIPRPGDLEQTPGTPAGPDGSNELTLGLRRRRPDLSTARALRRAALEKLAGVEAYARSVSCRRGALLEYFGEERPEPRAGCCDRCGPGATISKAVHTDSETSCTAT